MSICTRLIEIWVSVEPRRLIISTRSEKHNFSFEKCFEPTAMEYMCGWTRRLPLNSWNVLSIDESRNPSASDLLNIPSRYVTVACAVLHKKIEDITSVRCHEQPSLDVRRQQQRKRSDNSNDQVRSKEEWRIDHLHINKIKSYRQRNCDLLAFVTKHMR